MLKEKTFETDEVSINFVEGLPGGKPLVLLHGVTSWWQTFLPILPALSLRHHIYALDMRGHGRSSRTPGEYLISHDAADVKAFLRNVVNEPVVLLGWSLGAIVATLVAAEAPELVRGIILEDPPFVEISDDETAVIEIHEYFRALRNWLVAEDADRDRLSSLSPELDEVQLRRRFKQLNLCDPEMLTLIIEREKFENYRLSELLSKITCPVLLMQADPTAGGVMAGLDVQRAQSLLKESAHAFFPDAAHGIHVDQPTRYSQVVLDFIESL